MNHLHKNLHIPLFWMLLVIHFTNNPLYAAVFNHNLEPIKDVFSPLEQTFQSVKIDNYQLLDALYLEFENHFSGVISTNTNKKEKLNFKVLLGKSSSLKTFLLLKKFDSAIANQLPVTRFEKFGLTKLEDFDYQINLAINPQLVSYFKLFSLVRFSRTMQEQLLLPRGFRPEDIDILQHYGQREKLQQQFNGAYKTQLTLIYPKLKQTFEHFERLTPVKQNQIINQYHLQTSYLNYAIERNWAINLLNHLDKQRVRILEQVLIELIDGTIEKNSQPIDATTSSLVKGMQSGLMEKRFHKIKNETTKLNLVEPIESIK